MQGTTPAPWDANDGPPDMTVLDSSAPSDAEHLVFARVQRSGILQEVP